MGFFGKIGGTLSGQTTAAPRYMLTDTGEEKLAAMKVEGREFDLLSTVKRLQPTPTVREIAKELKWPANSIEKAVIYLENEGLLQKVG
jgi:DNA-binding MarR family transcriptional regulator